MPHSLLSSPTERMSSPLPYLIRMLLYLVAVAALAWVLHVDLLRVYLHTPILDGVILGVLLIGIFFWIMLSGMQGGGSRVMQFGKSRAKLVTKESPTGER